MGKNAQVYVQKCTEVRFVNRINAVSIYQGDIYWAVSGMDDENDLAR